MSVELILKEDVASHTLGELMVQLHYIPCDAECVYLDKPCNLATIKKHLTNRSRRLFHVSIDGITYTSMRGKGFRSFSIEPTPVDSLSEIDELVKTLIPDESLILARTYDPKYNHRQNEKQLDMYEAHGWSTEGLTLKKSHLPPPLDTMEVDISNNPGRTQLCDGYMEFVGNQMWFGDEFWKRSGLDRKVPDWWLEHSFQNGVDYYLFREQPFTDDSPGVELQDRIREFFFPPQTTAS